MTPIETDIEQYLLWLGVHNYAKTTASDRRRYLGYFTKFLNARGIDKVELVTFELLKEYQEALFTHRKVNGEPLTFGTQAQRLIPVQHFFTWLRRSGRINVNPASDLTLPRPDRRLPEATLSASEMAAFLSCSRRQAAARSPGSGCPRGVLLLRVEKERVDRTQDKGRRLRPRHRLRPQRERGQGPLRPDRGAALFWLRLYLELIRPDLCKESVTDYLFLCPGGNAPLCRLALETGPSLPGHGRDRKEGQLSPPPPLRRHPHARGRRRHPLRRRNAGSRPTRDHPALHQSQHRPAASGPCGDTPRGRPFNGHGHRTLFRPAGSTGT